MRAAAAVLLVPLVLFGALGNFKAQNPDESEDKVDIHLWENQDELEEKYPVYCSGFDDKGQPVWVFEFGKWDLRGFVGTNNHEKKKEFLDYFDEIMCRIQKSVKIMDTKEKPVNGWGFAIDMNGSENKQLTSVETITYCLLLAQKFHKTAGNMDYGFFINMDSIAELFIRLMKPALGSTFKQSELYKKEKEKWLPALLKHIPKRSLPEPLGGYDNFTAYPVSKC